jgi:hypothetical protein
MDTEEQTLWVVVCFCHLEVRYLICQLFCRCDVSTSVLSKLVDYDIVEIELCCILQDFVTHRLLLKSQVGKSCKVNLSFEICSMSAIVCDEALVISLQLRDAANT